MEKPDDFNLLDDLNNNPNQFINLYKMGIDGIAAKLELSTPDDNKLIAEVLFKYSILTAFTQTVYIPVKNIYDEYLKTHVAPDKLATYDDIANVEVQSNEQTYHNLKKLPPNYIKFCLTKIDGINPDDLFYLQNIVMKGSNDKDFIETIRQSNYNTVTCGKFAFYYALMFSTMDFDSITEPFKKLLQTAVAVKKNQILNKSYKEDSLNIENIVKTIDISIIKLLNDIIDLRPNDDILEEVRELAKKTDVMPYVDEIIVSEESGDLSFDIPTTLERKLNYCIINKATNWDYEINPNLFFGEQLSILSNTLPY